MLKGLDARVDGMINAASGLYASNAVALQAAVEHSEKGLAAAAAAKDAYLQRIESALGLLKVSQGCCCCCRRILQLQSGLLKVAAGSGMSSCTTEQTCQSAAGPRKVLPLRTPLSHSANVQQLACASLRVDGASVCQHRERAWEARRRWQRTRLWPPSAASRRCRRT